MARRERAETRGVAFMSRAVETVTRERTIEALDERGAVLRTWTIDAEALAWLEAQGLHELRFDTIEAWTRADIAIAAAGGPAPAPAPAPKG
ncbi:MAG TPA: hypothetical protein ENH89_22035 [Aurantimonas coralicida]|uniref:Uncharacterized protein n=1 Tax=Aurantimonas coralicida TaxID=182270 RepID=A0A9C9TJ20_9HYPH|nr:hypothetical protein [Aurantimonas coralicida]